MEIGNILIKHSVPLGSLTEKINHDSLPYITYKYQLQVDYKFKCERQNDKTPNICKILFVTLR